MKTDTTNHPKSKLIHMDIDGHKVTLSFSNEYNPGLAQLVRNALIDSYLRRTGALEMEQSVC